MNDNETLIKLEEMKDKMELIEKDITSYAHWIKENISFILNNRKEKRHAK